MATLDEPAEWEINAGLDEEPEPVLGASADTSCCEHFEVAKRDGIDLNIPLFCDLLSDKPEEDSIHTSTLTTGENEHQLPNVDICATLRKPDLLGSAQE
ncbi:hypothetical protein BN14_06303 [Rhizoctonia solani AG-1 IB]|uniref:Uncharacterized protein n=1 Tax=Thanatephorus cucumeris (strain AG1-IB / isolate 7/3/14) TaxID=1108050 RepID=M5BYB5_THACB|nr:hypothetical protein BN14_06303 [Rhizoctonia solani AG-1 IB]